MYTGSNLTFLISQRIIKIITTSIIIVLQLGKDNQTIIPWMLLWNFTYLPSSIFGIWLGNYMIRVNELSHYWICIHHFLNTFFQNILRLVVYFLLFILNDDDLPTAGVGFGFMFILHIFEIYVDIKNSIQNYNKLLDFSEQ
jgi:hypothetical protein